MIEKVIAAFFVSWVEISTRNWKNRRISSTQNKILPPIWKLLFSTRMCGIWRRKEKGLSMDANLVFLLCMCTPPLYNETLRACFTVGEKKKYQKNKQPHTVAHDSYVKSSGRIFQPDTIFSSTISVIIKISPSSQKRMTEIFRPVYSCSNQSAISWISIPS